MSGAMKGRLYLVPAPLDFGCDTQAPLQDVMPSGTLQVAARLSCWICEPPIRVLISRYLQERLMSP